MENLNTYQKRRFKLGQEFNQTAFIIPSGEQSKRSHSVGYRFKTPSDFYYLTGLEIPQAYLIIFGSEQILVRALSHDHVWDDLDALSQADQEKLKGLRIESHDSLMGLISDLISKAHRIAVPLGRVPQFDSQLLSVLSYDRRMRGRKINQPLNLCDSRTLVGRIRAIKDQTEIDLMRTAAQKSSRVHTELMSQNLIGKTELEISNWIEAGILNQNMQWTAYETIVGSGDRSTLLHARATQNRIQENDLVLIDAGGEWQGYCSDITRTLPAGSRFQESQKKLYQIVLDSQKAVLNEAKPGRTIQELHRLAQATLQEGLQKMTDQKLSLAFVEELMPHSTSHWIGLDVHDPADYFDENSEELRLQPGMTFTVEPALYFRSQTEGFESFTGYGVRIEDDILITETGCEVLTNVLKEIQEIEDIRQKISE